MNASLVTKDHLTFLGSCIQASIMCTKVTQCDLRALSNVGTCPQTFHTQPEMCSSHLSSLSKQFPPLRKLFKNACRNIVFVCISCTNMWIASLQKYWHKTRRWPQVLLHQMVWLLPPVKPVNQDWMAIPVTLQLRCLRSNHLGVGVANAHSSAS